MNELALFAGAGGGILGGHLLGWRTICAVEWEAYPASVLVARQNDKILPPFPIWDDVQTFDGKPWRGIVDVVSGGFPCQDISAAGKGIGITGKRSSMWGHMARIIGEVRPQFAFVENSPMLTSRGLGTVLGDLSEMGYDTEWCVLGAADVGANHKRDRIWILAYTNSQSDAKRRVNTSISKVSGQRSIDERRSGRNANGIAESTKNEEMDTKSGHSIGELADTYLCGCIHGQTKINSTIGELDALGEFGSSSSNVADTIEFRTQSELSNKGKPSERINCNGDAKRKEFADTSSKRLERSSKNWEKNFENGENTKLWRTIAEHSWWATEPNLGRVANGVAARVDRLKAIGNGQVPLCAATAWNILKGRIDAKNK